MELADDTSKRWIKWAWDKVGEIDSTRYKFYYIRKDRQKNEIGVIISKHFKDYVIAV